MPKVVDDDLNIGRKRVHFPNASHSSLQFLANYAVKEISFNQCVERESWRRRELESSFGRKCKLILSSVQDRSLRYFARLFGMTAVSGCCISFHQ
jgi:hypothetical protein